MKKIYEKGITLIALVITIILMLILAGTSISMLTGKNGILTKSIEAQKLSYVSSEKEAIELVYSIATMDNSLDFTNKYFIGKKLSSPKLDNVDWNIIVINNSSKHYGDSWNFISQGTSIENYGTTKYNWLINYNTGEIISLEENSFTELSSENNVAISDGLLFNFDATNIDSYDVSALGENVHLYYFDDSVYDSYFKRNEAYNEQLSYGDVSKFSGYDRQISSNSKNYIDLDNKTFKFNGNNYIEIYNKDGFDFSKGFTFEFYGNLNGYFNATLDCAYVPFLGLWNGLYNSQCYTRFGYLSDYRKKFHYNLAINTSSGSWPEQSHPYNQQYPFENFLNNKVYLTLVFNPEKKLNQATQSIYINGKLLAEGDFSGYDSFVYLAKNLNYIEFGRCTMSNISNWCYAKRCLLYI